MASPSKISTKDFDTVFSPFERKTMGRPLIIEEWNHTVSIAPEHKSEWVFTLFAKKTKKLNHFTTAFHEEQQTRWRTTVNYYLYVFDWQVKSIAN